MFNTTELDAIELFLWEHGETIESIQDAVYLDTECWSMFVYNEDFSFDTETLYETILFFYWHKFEKLIWNFTRLYYYYLYDQEWYGIVELQRRVDTLTEEQKNEISKIPYAMYFIRKFNLDLNI